MNMGVEVRGLGIQINEKSLRADDTLIGRQALLDT
jgi:hypothetical protein